MMLRRIPALINAQHNYYYFFFFFFFSSYSQDRAETGLRSITTRNLNGGVSSKLSQSTVTSLEMVLTVFGPTIQRLISF